MPCYMTGSAEGDEAYSLREDKKHLKEELQAVTRIACELAAALGGSKYGGVTFNALSKPTQQWVRKHEKIDKEKK